MSAKSKLTLLLELKDKLFNKKLQKVKANFNKTTNKMRGNMDKLKMSTLKGFKAMRDEVPLFGRAMSLLGNPYVLLAAGLLTVVTLFGKATMEAKSFEHSFLKIKNLNLDKSDKSLKRYNATVLDTAFQTGKGHQETAQGFYDLQSGLGIYGNEAKKVFSEVANYSTATGAKLDTSITSTIKGLKAFGLETADVTMLLKSNAKAVQTGIVDFDQLSKVQAQFGGSAGNIGQTIETANKIYAAFTGFSGSVAEASTNTKTFFDGLARSANKIEKVLDIDVFDVEGNFRQADAILKDIGKRFGNLSEKQVADLITQIGGPDGLNKLLFQMKGNSEDVLKTFEAFDSSKFDLDKALKNAMGDVTILSDIVKNRFSVVMARLGQLILPAVARVLNSINNFLTWMWDKWDLLGDIIESVGITLMLYVGYLGALKAASFLAAIASGGLGSALIGVQVSAIMAGQAIMAIPIIGWILAAIAGLILLYKRWDKFRAVIKGVGAYIFEFWSNFKENAKTIIGGVADMFVGLGKIIKGVLFFDPSSVNAGVNQLKKGFNDIKGASSIQAGIDAYKDELKLSAENKAENKKQNRLLTNDNTKNDDTTNSTTQDINSVTQKASQPRSIVINIEALNKGGINTSNTTLAHKSPEDIEEWFNEMMMRVVRGVELSHG